MKRLKAWWQRRKQEAAEEQFRRGYDYIAGLALRGEQGEVEIVYANFMLFDRSPFGKGMLAAESDAREKGLL